MKTQYYAYRIWTILCFLVIVGSWIQCSDNKKNSSSKDINALSVFVSLEPQAYILERIGGDFVSVKTLISKGQEPHSFHPSPKQLIELANATIYFTLGMPFEKSFIDKISQNNNSLSVINTTKGMALRRMKHDHHHHHHADETIDGTEDHADQFDPHVWLGMVQIKHMAHIILTNLIKHIPEQREFLQNNFDDFVKDLAIQHNKLSHLLKPYKGRKIYVFHPAFGYFTDTYQLIQEAVEVEGKSPSPLQLKLFIEKARNENVAFIFVQKQFSTQSAESIAKAIGAAIIPLDPLEKNLMNNFEIIAKRIEKSFEK